MAQPEEFTKAEKHTILAASCLAIFINPLVGSMLNLALTAIGDDLGCSTHQLGWLTSVYFVASVMAMMPAAKLSDIYGKKRIFVLGILIAVVGLVLSSTSRDIYMLYVYRALTGFGTAMISCNSVSMISDVYRRRERGMALSLHTACVYIGGSIGPTLGGVLTEFFGWRSLFIVMIPLLVLSLFFISRFGYNIKSSPDSRFDTMGAAVYMTGVLVTMLGILSLPEMYAFVLTGVGASIMIGFILIERKGERPLMDLRLFRNLRFSKSLTALFLNYASSWSISFFLSLYFQSIGAMTPSEAGLILMIQPAFQVVLTLAVGRFIDSIDYRILPTVGMGILCIALCMMMFIGTEPDLPYACACLALAGIGFGLFSSPNTTATMSYVNPSEYNEASGMISTMRQTGMMVSMATATCLIAIYMGSTAQLTEELYDTFVMIMRYTWGICIAYNVVGMIFSWFRGKAPASA